MVFPPCGAGIPLFMEGGVKVTQPALENKMGVMPENRLLLNMAVPMILSMLIPHVDDLVHHLAMLLMTLFIKAAHL